MYFQYNMIVVTLLFTLITLIEAQSILLTDIEVITVNAGRLTESRRTEPIPQLKCIGDSVQCNTIGPKSMRCINIGTNGWKCSGELPDGYSFGNIDVVCEGYTYPDDPYVLKNSCGVEYELIRTNIRPGSQIDLLPPNELNLPPGSYKETCGGCRLLDGDYLECDMCCAFEDDRIYSKIYTQGCSWIKNIYGTLRCNKKPENYQLPSNSKNIPYGSYTQECGGCNITEDSVYLICTHCLNRKYSIANPSIIRIDTCKHFMVDNGRLECDILYYIYEVIVQAFKYIIQLLWDHPILSILALIIVLGTKKQKAKISDGAILTSVQQDIITQKDDKDITQKYDKDANITYNENINKTPTYNENINKTVSPKVIVL